MRNGRWLTLLKASPLAMAPGMRDYGFRAKTFQTFVGLLRVARFYGPENVRLPFLFKGRNPKVT